MLLKKSSVASASDMQTMMSAVDPEATKRVRSQEFAKGVVLALGLSLDRFESDGEPFHIVSRAFANVTVFRGISRSRPSCF